MIGLGVYRREGRRGEGEGGERGRVIGLGVYRREGRRGEGEGGRERGERGAG